MKRRWWWANSQVIYNQQGSRSSNESVVCNHLKGGRWWLAGGGMHSMSASALYPSTQASLFLLQFHPLSLLFLPSTSLLSSLPFFKHLSLNLTWLQPHIVRDKIRCNQHRIAKITDLTQSHNPNIFSQLLFDLNLDYQFFENSIFL